MTQYLNQPINTDLELWDNFQRDLQRAACVSEGDSKDTVTRDEFMKALNSQLCSMLSMQTGRDWRILDAPKGGSWLCVGPDGYLLQITYKERTIDKPGQLKVMVRVSMPELNVWMNGLLDEENSPIYRWQTQHPMFWCIDEWATTVDLDVFTSETKLSLLKGWRFDYPDTWAMPSGTMALGWIYDDMIQPMTPKQVSWAARCIGQMAASMLLIKSMLSSRAAEEPLDTFPFFGRSGIGFYDKRYAGHPVLRDHLGRYYYDTNHGNVRIHLHWLLLRKPDNLAP